MEQQQKAESKKLEKAEKEADDLRKKVAKLEAGQGKGQDKDQETQGVAFEALWKTY
jgi:hypothetical protein